MRSNSVTLAALALTMFAAGVPQGGLSLARQPQPITIPTTPGAAPNVTVNGQPVRISPGAAAAPTEPAEATNPAPAGWWDDRPPQIGDEAPPLSFETIYDRPGSIPDPASFSWDQYTGKVVVIDFSTSWCGPCRMMVPHMNELVDALAGEPVVFMTVSNEAEAQVAKFRSDLEFKSLFARDVDGSTFEDYWVNGIPHIAVIDTHGKIAALTHPAHLNADHLKALVRGESVDIPRMNENPTKMNWNASRTGVGSLAPDGLSDALAYAVLTPVDARGTSFRANPSTGEFATDGATAASLVSYAVDLPARYVDVRAALPETTFYRAAIRPGDGSMATARRTLLAMLESGLGLEVTITNDPGPVRVLRVKDASLLPPLSDGVARSGSMSPGHIDMPSLTFEALARSLSNFTPVPIVDESGRPDKFAIRLDYDPRAPGSLTQALAGIGLELVEAQRPVRRAIVETAVE